MKLKKKILCLWILIMAALIAAPSVMAETTVEVYPVGTEDTNIYRIPEVRFLRGSLTASKTVRCTADVAELFAAINGSYSFTFWGDTYYFAEDPASLPDEDNNPLLPVPSGKSYPGGGKVILKPGIFEAGEIEYNAQGSRITQPMVIIGQSVEITGENATFKRGRFEINASENAKVNINNLTLENSPWAAISAEWEFENLIIENVKVNGIKSTFEDWAGGPWMRYGIRVGWWEESPLRCKSVSIRNCHIDLVGEDGSGDPVNDYEVDLDVHGQGITTYGLGIPDSKVNISINDNTLKNCSRHAIFAYDLAGKVIIKDNIIRSGNFGANFGGTTLNGIWSNQSRNFYFIPPDYWGPYQADWANLTIKNNDIECGPVMLGNGGMPIGILFDMPFTEIEKNRVKVENGIANIATLVGINGINDGSIIQKNTLSGNGSLATMWLSNARNCVVKNNNCKKANPVLAHIYCIETIDGKNQGLVENNVFIGNNVTGNAPTYFFSEQSSKNTVRGYSGGTNKVEDLTDYEPQKTYQFVGVAYPSDWSGEYWIPADEIIEQTFGPWEAGYYNDDITKPNKFDRENRISAIDQILWDGRPMDPWVLATLKIVNPVKTDEAHNPIVIEDGKQNFITGFEHMSGSPNPGPILSTHDVYIPSEQEIMDNLPE